MNAVDANILVYRFDLNEPDKRRIAQEVLSRLMADKQTILLWQALGELTNQLTKWHHQGRIQRADIVTFSEKIRHMFPLVMPTPDAFDRALDLASRYSLSHWDSMLLGACLEAGVTTLYTEDMGAPRQTESAKTIETIELVNPF